MVNVTRKTLINDFDEAILDRFVEVVTADKVVNDGFHGRHLLINVELLTLVLLLMDLLLIAFLIAEAI
jgi:hypothetical protein